MNPAEVCLLWGCCLWQPGNASVLLFPPPHGDTAAAWTWLYLYWMSHLVHTSMSSVESDSKFRFFGSANGDTPMSIFVTSYSLGGSGHRMNQVGRDHSGLLGPISLLQQGRPRAHGIGLCPGSSGLSPLREIS